MVIDGLQIIGQAVEENSDLTALIPKFTEQADVVMVNWNFPAAKIGKTGRSSTTPSTKGGGPPA